MGRMRGRIRCRLANIGAIATAPIGGGSAGAVPSTRHAVFCVPFLLSLTAPAGLRQILDGDGNGNGNGNGHYVGHYARRRRRRRRGRCCGRFLWRCMRRFAVCTLALLLAAVSRAVGAHGTRGRPRGRRGRTASTPILYWPMSLRASAECPISSNARVASFPAWSSSTSEPPGCCGRPVGGAGGRPRVVLLRHTVPTHLI